MRVRDGYGNDEAPSARYVIHGPAGLRTDCTQVHPLDNADEICPKCDGTLEEMTGQTEDSE